MDTQRQAIEWGGLSLIARKLGGFEDISRDRVVRPRLAQPGEEPS